MPDRLSESRFICDRMFGALCRFLRLLGYDTLNANDLTPGNPKEDSILLIIAKKEDRILLTRDAELARRDPNRVFYLVSERLEDQIRTLIIAGYIKPNLRLTRCSLCNHLLAPASDEALSEFLRENPSIIFNSSPDEEKITWCRNCRKIYWEGSHTRKMREQIHQIYLLGEEGRTSA
ncbi:Mut7-C RNAse domain-containing protein [Methanospirillum lacunae]|uniref:Mut7-C RNAse domain-containing protein n=1 Tax=Methanospirillum lacunae TaxID=668570 RepID=A0A2V2N0D3_9EURY|nr:Mut7-C RNAse domain-containing protein [Methanospirillum lacunae]PWR73179.1 hypothetical protein DK846_04955 [Methanospirillum lacunae]